MVLTQHNRQKPIERGCLLLLDLDGIQMSGPVLLLCQRQKKINGFELVWSLLCESSK